MENRFERVWEDVGRPARRLLQVSQQETVVDWPRGVKGAEKDLASGGSLQVKSSLQCDELDAESKGKDDGRKDG